jgi:hypothetical protein
MSASDHGRSLPDLPARRPSQPLIAGAPAFRDIVNSPGMTATALYVILTTSHRKMPNLLLKPEQMENIVVDILRLHR